MNDHDVSRSDELRVAESALSVSGMVVLVSSWVGNSGGRSVEVGSQLLLAALGWRCGRQWARRRPVLADGAEPDVSTATTVLATVAVSVLLQLLVTRHAGGIRSIVAWDPTSPPGRSLLGHLWVVGAALMLAGIATLVQRIAESLTASWRLVLAAAACSAAGFSFGEWLTSPESTVGESLSLVASSWGFAAALALALVLPVGLDSAAGRSAVEDEADGRVDRVVATGLRRFAAWSLVPLSTVHERPGRWLLGSFLWGWPAAHLFVDSTGAALAWLPMMVVAAGSVVGGWIVSILGGWRQRRASLAPATRRAISVSLTAALVLVGTSTAVSAGGVIGGPGLRTDPRGLLQVAVPEFDVVVPRPLEVFLVGDSTMAPMRWFRQGQASLSGFDYVLDVESCRRIAKRSCWGRESRIPTSATLAILSRRRNFDYVVLMAGAHSTRKDLAEEVRMAQQAAQEHGAKLLIVTLRESERYVQADVPSGESAFAEFNRIIRRVADELGPDKVSLIDWNGFSNREPGWFRSDGIHPNLTGTIALGWFLSQSIAAEAGNPCPSDWTYPCPVPGQEATGRNWLDDFGVTPTEEHCYEDGNDRIRVCQRDRRM